MKRWRGGCRLSFYVSRYTEAKFCSRKPQVSFITYFRRSFVFSEILSRYEYNRHIIWQNKTCDEDKLRCLQFIFKMKIPTITDYESLVQRVALYFVFVTSYNKIVMVVKAAWRRERWRKSRLFEIFDCHSTQLFLLYFTNRIPNIKRYLVLYPVILCYMIFMTWARGLVSLVCFGSIQLHLVSTWCFNL